MALAAAIARLRTRDRGPNPLPSGIHSEAGARARSGILRSHPSHATQDYPEFEILFGVQRSGRSSACADIRRLAGGISRRAHPPGARGEDAQRQGGACSRNWPGRRGTAAAGERQRYLSWRRIICAAWSRRSKIRGTGVVTCLYRARAESVAGAWEAIGIATDFAPGVLVAPLSASPDSRWARRWFSARRIWSRSADSQPSAITWRTIISSGAHRGAGLQSRAGARPWWRPSCPARVGRGVAAPTALVANHSRFAPGRLLRLRDHQCQRVGGFGGFFRRVAGGFGLPGHPHSGRCGYQRAGITGTGRAHVCGS